MGGDGPRRSVGIDVLKGLAILGVIAQHVFTPDGKHALGAPLWVNQAVPVFVFFIGLNGARSFARARARTLRDVYTTAYLRSRWRRLVVPVLPVYAVVLVVGIAQGRLNLGGLQLVGAAPLDGGAPGDYFIALVLSIAVLFPAVWVAYVRAPRVTLLLLVLVSVLTELVARHVLVGSALAGYIGVSNPFRVAATLAAGIWFAGQPSLAAGFRRHRWWFGAAAAVSLAYLVVVWLDREGAADGFGVLLPGFIIGTGVWALGWTLALTVGVVSAVDRRAARGSVTRTLAQLGLASYHVFLVQAAVIGLWRTADAGWLAVEALGAVAIGWTYWRLLEGRTAGRRRLTPALDLR